MATRKSLRGKSSPNASPPHHGPGLSEFPCATCLAGCEAERDVHDLLRLLTTDLTYSQFLDGALARRLVGTMLRSYKNVQSSPRWKEDPFLAKFGSDGERFAKVLSAIFDYATNVEYCSTRLNRITDNKWIYCTTHTKGQGGTDATAQARVFFSFLKQCPCCCLSLGLGARIEGAQHKPASHHIGEISGSLMGMVLVPLLSSHEPPLTYAMVTKQSHSVDAVAFSKDIAVLFEIKASPLVTFPLAADLPRMLKRETDDGSQDYLNHQLVDFRYDSADLYFFVPHRDGRIPLGRATSPTWPYEPATEYVAHADGFLDYLSAWGELFEAFSVPKTERAGRIAKVAYLTNGWGDEIDSNKTKPGLGRTDDLKKGTYQLLKYGAYYKDRCKRNALFSALLANLDPVNLWAAYLERLIDVRWTKDEYVREQATVYEVPLERLHYLYEALVALNRPTINEPVLRSIFDFKRSHDALCSGALDTVLLNPWTA
jgi:hypothetical protein